jgi:hypothetical protein
MKIIYSHWKSGSHLFCNKEMARLSLESVKKIGYKTCLYTDIAGYDLLSDVAYDEIIIFDEEILKSFNPKIWSLGKILAMSLAQEPFIHLDFDFFLFKKLDDEIAQRDFFSLYYEPWINTDLSGYAEKVYKQLAPFLDGINTNNFKSYNFSIVGGQSYKKISSACQNIVSFAIQHQNTIDQIPMIKKWGPAVLFEQVMIPDLLLNKYNTKIQTIFPDFSYTGNHDEAKKFIMENCVKHKMVHLHGQKLEKLNVIKGYLT